VRSFGGASELSGAQLRDAPVHWPRPSALDVSLEALEGVGPKLAEAAAGAGISTVGDLLIRFPHRHRDRQIVSVASLGPKQQATILVEVLADASRPFRRKGLSILSVKVGDESGTVRATWFNQPWLAPKLKQGTQLLLTGSADKRGFRVSEYELGGDAEEGLLPVHPGTEDLKPQKLRQWMEQAISSVGNVLEPLPTQLRVRRRLAGAADPDHA
jgi:ATP-dependent DNA helicase RecG